MENELQHHGIKGMKWGVRRFQRKDGSLTLLGKRRAAKQAESEDKPKPKKVSDMSDTELQSAIKRLQLEKQYRDLNPEKVSVGKDFVNKTIIPAVTEGGKRLLTDFLINSGKKALGLKDGDDELGALKKSVEKLNLEKQFKDLTKDRSVEERVQKLNLEKQLKDLTKDRSVEEEVRRRTLEKQLKKLKEEEND